MSNRPSSVVVMILVVVATGMAVLAALYATGIVGTTKVRVEELNQVLIVVASPDEDGSIVAQIVVITDIASGERESVSPALPVSIPGTSYESLADAYPFGGGAGTAAALARAVGEDPLPYVAFGPDELVGLVEGTGGLTLSLPAAVSVFDGDTLYSFEPGKQVFDAREVQALLKGAPYLEASARSRLDVELGEALVDALRESPDLLYSAETNLSDEALDRLRGSM